MSNFQSQVFQQKAQKAPLIAKVGINPGHIPEKPGCLSKDGKITEHQCTVKAVKLLKGFCEEYKVPADILSNPSDSLEQIGYMAEGYGLFVSVHFNACNKKANYTSVLVDRRYVLPSSQNLLVASRAAEAMAKALGLPLYEDTLYPKGVMGGTLRVLSAASKTSCPYVFLVEPFFLDCYSNEAEIDAMIEKAMRALANVIKEVLCP